MDSQIDELEEIVKANPALKISIMMMQKSPFYSWEDIMKGQRKYIDIWKRLLDDFNSGDLEKRQKIIDYRERIDTIIHK